MHQARWKLEEGALLPVSTVAPRLVVRFADRGVCVRDSALADQILRLL